MNPVISTLRPALSTVVISDNQRVNSRILDNSLAMSQKEYSSLSMEEPAAHLLLGRDFLGIDDNNHTMYSLTRKENWLFSAGAIAGLTILGYICKWILM
ncbi:hypothetical protein [Spirosoma lituiforme]|jgi:hypothetical protein